jgi:hypothetical protein
MGDDDAAALGAAAATLATLGEWYAFRGVNEWAVQLLARARADGAKVSSLTLARCYWQLDRRDDAAREFADAVKHDEAPAAYLRLCLAAVSNAPATGPAEAEAAEAAEAEAAAEAAATTTKPLAAERSALRP